MNFRNFEMKKINGFIEIPCKNGFGVDLRNVTHASNFVRHLKKNIDSIIDACVSVEETTATIEVTARPTLGDSHGEKLGRLIATKFTNFLI